MRSTLTLLAAMVLALAVAGAAVAAARPAAKGSPAAGGAAAESPAPASVEGPRDCGAAPAPLEKPGADAAMHALGHYIRGRLRMASQEALLAAEEFRQAAALQPGVARIWLNLGLTLYDSGNVTGATAALEEALRMDPADPATLYFRARIAATQGDPQRAADLLSRLVAAGKRGTPYHILGTYHLARACHSLGDTAAAVAHYQNLLALLAEPQSFFQRYPELYLLFRSQVQLKQTLASLLVQRRDNDKAIAVLQEALAERPGNTEILGLLSTACLQKKDYAAARDWARKVIEVHPDGPAGYQQLAEVYKAEGKAAAVIPDLEGYRRDHPDNRMLAFQLAAAYESVGRKDDAAAIYRELSARTDQTPGTSVAAALKLADLHAREGRPVQALEALAGTMVGEGTESAVLVRAAQLIDGLKDPDPVWRDAQRLVADDVKGYGPFLLVGMLAERVKRRDDAIALYDKALTRQPKAAIAYSRKADLLIEAGQLEAGLSVYRAAIQAGLDFPLFHRKMGMILEQLDRLDDAISEYRVTRQAAPEDKPTRYLLAEALARRGKFDEAEAELKGLLARYPKEVQAHSQLAVVYLAKGDLAAAEGAVAQAQSIDAEALGPKALLAEIRMRQKRFDDAERLAREILAAQPGDHEVRLLLAYALSGRKQFKEAVKELRGLLAAAPENLGWRYLLAGVYAEMGDQPAAEKELQRILQTKPDHAPSNNDLGYMWADRGVNLTRAEEMIRQALKADPQSPAYLDSLGWVLYKRGQFGDAVKWLEDATHRAPDLDAVLWDHLGDSYWQLNRRDDAHKAWQQAAKILTARGQDAKADDVERVQQKVKEFEAGAAPKVAPVAPEEKREPSARKP